MKRGGLRRFVLNRLEDVSGISGTGIIAEGVLSSTGQVAIFWLTRWSSVAIYPSIADVVAIHGHDGKTSLDWLDASEREEGEPVAAP